MGLTARPVRRVLAPVTRGLRERGQVDDGVIGHKSARHQTVADDSDVPAEAHRRVVIEGAVHDAVQKRPRIGGRRARPPSPTPHRVDRVAAHQLRQERRERPGPVEQVQPVALPPHDEHGADLVVRPLDARHVVIERLAVFVEHRAHRLSRGRRSQPLGLLGDRVPHLSLIGVPASVRTQRMPHARHLFRPAAHILHPVGHSEVPLAVRPAARLHARHRDHGRLPGRDQHRQVGDAILLGAHELLPVDDEHRPVGTVLHCEFGYAAPLRHLPYGDEVLPQPVLEKKVRERTGPVRRQRKHGESAVVHRLRQRQAGQRGLDEVHGSLLMLAVLTSYLTVTGNHQYVNSQ